MIPILKKLFDSQGDTKTGETIEQEEASAKKHFYKNHKEVTETLVQKYGFRYGGLGDNSEECFYKDGECDETVYIHPMFCSYIMHPSDGGWKNRPHDVSFQSDYTSQISQQTALLKLYAYLNEHSLKESELNNQIEKKLAKEEVLDKALRSTLNMLINVCPSDLAGDKELIAVINQAEEALKSA